MPPAAGVPTQLGHVALRVADLDKSITFYRDVIGMTLRGQY
ncbi:MAG TPA: VOC family protein, partial [Chloroflexota bacterium]|nr:VOC family protein [Chloroflexota bacterium]